MDYTAAVRHKQCHISSEGMMTMTTQNDYLVMIAHALQTALVNCNIFNLHERCSWGSAVACLCDAARCACSELLCTQCIWLNLDQLIRQLALRIAVSKKRLSRLKLRTCHIHTGYGAPSVPEQRAQHKIKQTVLTFLDRAYISACTACLLSF